MRVALRCAAAFIRYAIFAWARAAVGVAGGGGAGAGRGSARGRRAWIDAITETARDRNRRIDRGRMRFTAWVPFCDAFEDRTKEPYVVLGLSVIARQGSSVSGQSPVAALARQRLAKIASFWG
nr:hypothetical protein Ade03nite_37640 [Actinoplanes derwentensis]